MLKLTRRVGDTLTIADGITVTVINISGNRVLLGIEADERIPILRTEAKKKSPVVCAETPGSRGD